jgi:hypothetical protein
MVVTRRDCLKAVLGPDGVDVWLGGGDPVADAGTEEAVQHLACVAKMNSPRYNEPDCIEPLVATA